MSREKKTKRELEEMGKGLTMEIYNHTLARLEGEYYGRCVANFDGMVRRGEICVGEGK